MQEENVTSDFLSSSTDLKNDDSLLSIMDSLQGDSYPAIKHGSVRC